MFARLLLLGAFICTTCAPAAAYPIDFGPAFHTTSVAVDGATISATVGGPRPGGRTHPRIRGGFAHVEAAGRSTRGHHTVIAPDLPGFGNSSIPSSGLNMETSAKRVRDAVVKLGYRNVAVVGHDIGLMVAYAYAAEYPHEVRRLR